jgi:hypothetical protein
MKLKSKSKNELREVIDAILNDIINFTSANSQVHVPIDEIKSMISERDKNKVLTDVNFGEVKQAYWEIVDKCESEESYSKIHSAETYLNKGIAVLNERERSFISQNENSISDSRVSTGLTVEALRYRYNNDKSPVVIE